MFKNLLILLFILYAAAILGYLGHLVVRRRWLAKTAMGLVISGVLLQTGLLGWRWWQAGYLPVTNLFSTLFFFSWALALIYLYFELRYRIRATGLFVMVLNLVLLGGALPREAQVSPLIPSLDTPHLPEKPLLRKINEEAIFLGFGLFTLCMIAGSIWAYIAWGYWFSWNIKSVWSCLVWIFYAGMCHAKFVKRWQGGVYAWLSIAGFGVVLFTYLGIGLLLESNHPLE